MSSTSSNIVHAVFPTQALRLGEAKHASPRREGAGNGSPQEAPAGAPAAAPSPARPAAEAGAEAAEAQASFSFINAEKTAALAPTEAGREPQVARADAAIAAASHPAPEPAGDAEESGPRTQEVASVDPPREAAANWSQFPPPPPLPPLHGEPPTTADAADDFAAPEAPSPAGGEVPIAADALAWRAPAEQGAELADAQPSEDAHPVDLEGLLPIAPGGSAMPPAPEAAEGTLQDAAAALPGDGAGEADAQVAHAPQAVAADAAAEPGRDSERALPAGATARPARPLTHALDAAARLAADANAAAAALDNLKRLLQQGLPSPTAPAAPSSLPAAAPAKSRPREQAALPRRLPTAASPPLQMAPAQFTLPVPLPAAERARFDLRGFLAGFALSWAIGVVLYLFMTAG